MSVANSTVDDTFVGIAETTWAGRPGYRIVLRGYQTLTSPIHRDNFLKGSKIGGRLRTILQNNTHLFYNRDLNFNQGGYITKAPVELVKALNYACKTVTGKPLPHLEKWGTYEPVDNGGIVCEPQEKYKVSQKSREEKPISIDDIIEDFFVERKEFEFMVSLLKSRKNLILQGPPGVGKSFMARGLAYALMEEQAEDHLQMVQFHQSYAYEDFVQGYRPTPEGGFELKNGVFFEFCERARQSPSEQYVFIVDEINRGNLSKIFGELMLLIEHDKRGENWTIPLAYQRSQDPDFFVPENLYLLGLMNTADRSLAVVDYALRRRFAFVDLKPQFNSERFRNHLCSRKVPDYLVERICERFQALNKEISSDTSNLGPGFCIGHSYFCLKGEISSNDAEVWFNQIIETEVAPLLREYYFDDPEKADNAVNVLKEAANE